MENTSNNSEKIYKSRLENFTEKEVYYNETIDKLRTSVRSYRKKLISMLIELEKNGIDRETIINADKLAGTNILKFWDDYKKQEEERISIKFDKLNDYEKAILKKLLDNDNW